MYKIVFSIHNSMPHMPNLFVCFSRNIDKRRKEEKIIMIIFSQSKSTNDAMTERLICDRAIKSNKNEQRRGLK